MTEIFDAPRLWLAAPLSGDLDALWAIYGDARTHAFNPAGPPASRDEATARLSRWVEHWRVHGFGMWRIGLKAAPEVPVGFGGVAYRDFAGVQRPNLGYRFRPEVWGQGLATELAVAALQASFGPWGLHEVWATVRENHAASRRVLEKVGMGEIGLVQDLTGAPRSVHLKVDHAAFLGSEGFASLAKADGQKLARR